MVHLSAEGIVHRDLACRNLLLDKTNQVKITDFGLARIVDLQENEGSQSTRTNVGPIKWMAPECLTSRIYSPQSDVWSFGIVVVEMLLQSTPYPNLEQIEVGRRICQEYYTHPIPPNTSIDLANLMNDCWKFDPKSRPSFMELLGRLEIIAQPFS